MAYGKLAQKGRYGDDRIREVLGRKSHVNKRESNLIDLYGMLGERLVQREGAGTINPKTGLPEYHGSFMNPFDAPTGHPLHHQYYEAVHAVEDLIDTAEDFYWGEGDYEGAGLEVQLGLEDAPPTPEEISLGEKKESYEGAMDLFDKDVYAIELGKGQDAADEYLRLIGIPEEKIPFFESIVDIEGALKLAGQAKTLSGEAATIGEQRATLAETTAESQYGKEGEAYRGAGAAFDIGEKGVKEQFRAGEEAYRIGGLSIGEGERAASAQYGLGMEQAGLVAGRNLMSVKQQSDIAAVKGGFATQGAGAMKRAQRGVFQDYRTQQKQLEETKSSAMTRFGFQREGLASDWLGTQTQYGETGLAMEGLTEARTGAETRADISYRDVMGIGTAAIGVEGEEGYVPASEDYQAGSADLTRAGAGIDRRQADLTYQQKKFTLGQQAADEWWEMYGASEYD